MKKILFLFLLLIPFCVFALEYPSLNSKYVEIYDLNDKQVLYEVNSNDVVSIASLTKIATTITAIESIENLDEQITITSSILNTVSWEASVAGLRAGDRLTYRDLLYASMLPSGADATHSLAILSSGSISKFVDKMNDLAKRIGLEHTHFVNVTGLDIKDHYSTADDVRKLLEYSLQNELFRKVYTTKEYTMSNGKTVKTTLFTYNRNSSSDTSTILGSKTGFTLEAGYCLASLSNINGHEMIIIVLKAEKKNNTFYNIVDTAKLIGFMNENYKDETLVVKDKLIKEIPISLSKIDRYSIYSSQEIKKYLPSDYDSNNIKIVYDGLEVMNYKNKVGEQIGVVNYYYKDELLLKQEVVLDKEIEISYKKFAKKYRVAIGVVILLILLIIILIIRRIIKRKKRKSK
jgi:D-alanyl-D-alanine carboxypeptidase (penicillin-binding protein 5/6)